MDFRDVLYVDGLASLHKAADLSEHRNLVCPSYHKLQFAPNSIGCQILLLLFFFLFYSSYISSKYTGNYLEIILVPIVCAHKMCISHP